MAYIDCKLKSQILGTTVGVKLYFPTDLPADVGYTVKGVLTLLHGYTLSLIHILSRHRGIAWRVRCYFRLR